MGAKTAVGLLRYCPQEAVAVIDSTHAGRTARDVLGFGPAVPIVTTLAEAAAHGPDALLVGVSPVGGALPEGWRAILLDACARGLDIVSGLHAALARDAEIAAAAARSGAQIWDLRAPAVDETIARGTWRMRRAGVVLTVGTDARCGKMTAGIELHRGLQAAGLRSAFVATGQTGILVCKRGVPADAIKSDFLAGAIEREVDRAASDADVVVVEGQGSILHQGFSAVSMGILHGAAPDAMVLCHQVTRARNTYGDTIDDLPRAIRLHEAALSFRVGRLAAIALLTHDLSERDARASVEAAHRATGLPATDVIRFGVEPIVEGVRGALAATAVAENRAAPTAAPQSGARNAPPAARAAGAGAAPKRPRSAAQ
jgi:uncharacterized NAD-dependent epimerase/dehydratase family protein